MKLLKFIRFMTVVTFLTLTYIHMQMKIFDLAYKAKQKEKAIISLSEDNGVTSFKILELKSAHHLGSNLLTEKSGLRFQDHACVMQVVATENLQPQPVTLASTKTRKQNVLLSFLSSKFPVEAQAHEKKVDDGPWSGLPWR